MEKPQNRLVKLVFWPQIRKGKVHNNNTYKTKKHTHIFINNNIQNSLYSFDEFLHVLYLLIKKIIKLSKEYIIIIAARKAVFRIRFILIWIQARSVSWNN